MEITGPHLSPDFGRFRAFGWKSPGEWVFDSSEIYLYIIHNLCYTTIAYPRLDFKMIHKERIILG